MTSKLQFSDKSPIPAGLFGEGIEAFWYAGEKWVIVSGVRYLYNDSPTRVKSIIQREFMNDKLSLSYMATRMRLKNANEMFDTWYRCVVGGLDSVPDFGQKFTPDAFNNLCTDHKCPHRGILCSRATGLKNYEVETIAELKRGESVERASHRLFISPRGMKSRVEKIKEKMNVPNMAALMVTATQLGI